MSLTLHLPTGRINAAVSISTGQKELSPACEAQIRPWRIFLITRCRKVEECLLLLLLRPRLYLPNSCDAGLSAIERLRDVVEHKGFGGLAREPKGQPGR